MYIANWRQILKHLKEDVKLFLVGYLSPSNYQVILHWMTSWKILRGPTLCLEWYRDMDKRISGWYVFRETIYKFLLMIDVL